MRSTLLAFILLVRIPASLASDNTYLDSLWNAYNRPGQEVKARLNTFHEIIVEMRYEDADSAKTLARIFLKDATAHGNADLIALAHRDLADALAEADRDNDAALREYRTSIAIWRTIGDSMSVNGIATALNSMGMLFKNRGELDSAMGYYRRSVELQRHLNNYNGRNALIYSYASIARVHELQGRQDSALHYYTLSGQYAEALQNQRMIAASMGNRANVLESMGRIGEAIDLAYKCLAIMEAMGNERGVAVSLTTVASLKNELGETAEALDLLRRSHALYTKVGYRQGMMSSGNRIGSALLEMGQADSAVTWLEPTLALERELEARDIMGRTLIGLADAYRKSHRTTEAVSLLKEALTMSRELKNAPDEADTQALLGRIALDGGSSSEAVAACSDGLRIARETGAKEARAANCECLYLAFKTRGDGMNALRYLEEWHAVLDSIKTEKNTKELTQRDMLHTFGKEQLADSLRHANELMLSNMAAASARRRSIYYGGFGLVILAGLTAFFISDRKRRKARFEKDAAQLETQALRSQMNPHFIFNALNSISSFVQKNEPDRAVGYLSKFARLMRLVLENSRQAEVPLKDDLEALDAYLHLERTRSGEKFDYTITVDPAIDQEDVMVPPLVIQPFVENAIWHGMAGREGKGHITLSVSRQNDQLVMAIEDDGVGRHGPKPVLEGAQKKSSLATTITQARLDLVQKQKGKPAGFRIIDLEKGTRVEVSLPISEAA